LIWFIYVVSALPARFLIWLTPIVDLSVWQNNMDPKGFEPSTPGYLPRINPVLETFFKRFIRVRCSDQAELRILII
jgi:hypothetical protein